MKTIFRLAAVTLFLYMFSSPVHAQTWQALGADDALLPSANEAAFVSSAVSQAGDVYIAYQDYAPVFKLSVKKFNGTGWVYVGGANFSTGTISSTSIAFDGNTPYVAYGDGFLSGKATVKKFDGTTWVTVGNAGFSAGGITSPALVIDGGIPYLAYQDAANGNKATVMKLNGTTWEAVGTEGFTSGTIAYPSLAFSGGIPYLAYQDGSSNKVTVRQLNGSSWDLVGSAGFSTSTATYISLAFDGTTPYVAFADGNNITGKTTVMKFTSGAWGNVGSALFSTNVPKFISLRINGDIPYINYQDASDGKAHMKSFDGTSWVDVGAGYGGSMNYMSTVFSGTTPYTSYQDQSNSRAVVYKFDGTNWVLVGTTSFTNPSGSAGAMGVSGTTPYVAYNDANASNKLTMKKYDGTDWVVVGTAGFTAGGASGAMLAMDGSTPYVSYADQTQTSKASVMKFDGSTWGLVGTAGFTAGFFNSSAFAVAGGTPYFAYIDFANANKVALKKYSGSAWVDVGTINFTAKGATSVGLAVSGTTPYISYVDNTTNKASVIKYDGTNWASVGSAISSGNGSSTSIEVSGTTPYIAYTDASFNGKVSVKKFDGTNWVLIGPASILSTVTFSLKMNRTTPYIIYPDQDVDGRATLKKFDGLSWITVGGVPLGSVGGSSVSVYTEGDKTYAAYTASNKAYVKVITEPYIDVSGTLAALNTTYGTASPTGSFTVSGQNLTAGILVTPPTGFEVSASSNSGFANTITVGGSGTVTSTTVYIRMAEKATAGDHSGDVLMTSTGAGAVPIATTLSTVTAKALTITATGPSKIYGTALAITTGTTNFTAPAGDMASGETVTSVKLTPDAAGLATGTAGGTAYVVTPGLATGTGGFLASNYQITYTAYNGMVAGKPLTITATGPSKQVGEALSISTSTNLFTTSTPRSGETVTQVTLTPDAAGLSASTTLGSAYTITPSAATGTGGFLAGNYAISYLAYNGTVVSGSPVLSASGTPSALSTIYGTASSTTTVEAGGSTLTTGIVITAPDGFEVSTDASTGFNQTITLGSGGSISTTTIYVRLKANAAAGDHSGNVTLTSAPASPVSLALTASTVTALPLTITATGPEKIYGSAMVPTLTETLFSTSSGLASGETITSLTLTPNGAAANPTTAAGSAYILTPGLATGAGGFLESNYQITYNPYNGIVAKKAMSVTATGPVKTIGTALISDFSSINFTFTGAYGSETVNRVRLVANPAALSATTALGDPYVITPEQASGINGFSSDNYDITYVAYNGTVRTPLSSNADLSGLTITESSFNEVFSPATLKYTATVLTSLHAIKVKPVASDVNATITVNNILIASGGTSADQLLLNIGSNLIAVTVTAADGTIKNYEITVNRTASSNADLSQLAQNTSGSFSPPFTIGTLDYALDVKNSESTMTLAPRAQDSQATIKVNGIATTTVADLNLAVGVNTITIEVKATNGNIKTTFVTVKRHAAPVLNLPSAPLTLTTKVLTISAAQSFTISAPGIEKSVVVAVVQPFQISTDGLTNWTSSLNFAASIFPTDTTTKKIYIRTSPLVVGTVTGMVELTSTGTPTKTLALTSVSTPSTNAELGNLQIEPAALSPVFNKSIGTYTGALKNTTTSVTVIATFAEAEQTVKVNGVSVQDKAATVLPVVLGINNFEIVVTAADGTTKKTYKATISRAEPNQAIPDATGAVIVSNQLKDVIVTSPTQELTVTVVAGTTDAGVDYGALLAAGTATIPKTTINTGSGSVQIPSSTKVTASNPAWDGVISAPKITSYEFAPVSGQTITTGIAIEVGNPTISLSFDKAVRLLLPGQKGMRAAFVHNGQYKEISQIGTSDTQAEGDLLAPESAFKMDVGNDLVIWTKAFSRFLTFTQTTDLNVAVVAADKVWLTADLIRNTNTDLDNIVTTLADPLPATAPGGSSVTWSSSNPAVLSADGKTVNRPLLGSSAATVTLTATIQKGLISQTREFILTVLPLPNQAPTIALVTNRTLCFSPTQQNIALSGITAGPESGQTTTLSISSSNTGLLSGLAVNSTTGIITFTPVSIAGGTTIISITVKDNGGTANGGTDTFISTFAITIAPLPVIVINSSLGTDVSKGLTTTLTATGGTTYSWSTAAGIVSTAASLTVRPLVTTTYTVTATNASGCTSIQSITIKVLEDYMALDGANILTPNDDGKNDMLVIKNLDMYPNNLLKIYDRSGRLIYSKQNYTNDWAGSLNGSPLESDTYYYILDFGPDKGQLKGFVSIVR